MDMRLTGRRALVTGAAGGIGAATSRALAEEGVRLALLDASPGVAALAADLTSHGVSVISACADLADTDSAIAAVDALLAELGALDLLVLCAGVSGPVGTPIEDTALEDWERVLAVNVTGAFLAVRQALPALRRSDAPAVVVVASDSAFVAAPGMAPYGASKAALLQFARAAAVELAPGVRVNAVCPSVVDTPMSRGDLGLPRGFADAAYPVQTAAEVADQIVFLCSPRSRPVNATAIVSDFGVSAGSGFPA